MIKPTIASTLTLMVLTLPGVALADVALPVDEACKAKTSKYQDCDRCRESSLDGRTCREMFVGTEYEYICSLPDEATGEDQQVWCANRIQEEDDSNDDGGCTVAVAASAPPVVLLLLTGLGLAAWLRRRR